MQQLNGERKTLQLRDGGFVSMRLYAVTLCVCVCIYIYFRWEFSVYVNCQLENQWYKYSLATE